MVEDPKELQQQVYLEQIRKEHELLIKQEEQRWKRELDEWKDKRSAQMEQWRAEWGSKLEEYRADRAMDREMAKATCAAGQGALKATIIINGGASVALLAFISNTWISNADAIAGLAGALIFYVAAVLCGAVAAGATYISQFAWGYEWPKTAHIVNLLTVLIGIGSYVLFALGTYHAYQAFITHTAGN